DAHLVEGLSHLQLLFQRHGGAGTLLTVAQRGVEDVDPLLVARGLSLGIHGLFLSNGRRDLALATGQSSCSVLRRHPRSTRPPARAAGYQGLRRRRSSAGSSNAAASSIRPWWAYCSAALATARVSCMFKSVLACQLCANSPS